MRFRAAVISLLLVAGPLGLLFLGQGSAAAPIEAPADIYSIESWSLATSPVRITGNVVVHEGAVLNIKEGTEVLFNEGTSINVEGGTLVIQGTLANPVRFLPNSSSPYKGFYQWIFVNSTLTNQASVSVQWAEFSYGVKGLYLDGVQGARIENVKFNDTAESGVYLSSCSDVQVRNCTFARSDGWGLKAEFSNNLLLANNVFSGCTASSVALWDCEYSSVTSTTVKAGSSEKGVQIIRTSHLLVDGIVIEDAITGLALESSAGNTVDSCTFTSNGVGLELNATSDTLFRVNKFNGCAIPLSFFGGLELASNRFELSNLIDGLPVRAVSGGNLDGVSAGAVVLLNCPGSVVSNITFPPSGGGVIVLFGGGNTLRDLSLVGSAGGIVVLGSNGILIENVSVTGPAKSGITLWGAQGLGIRDSRVGGCQAGISFLGPMNITVVRTTLKNAVSDLALSEQAVVQALDCTFATVSVDAGSRLDEDYTLTVEVRDNKSLPAQGVDLVVENGGKPLYTTSRFGGIAQLSDAGGSFPPLVATGTVHAGASVSPKNTTIEVWDGVRAYDWNPRTLVLTAPTTAVFTATDKGFLAGMVRDPAGDPVVGANILLDSGVNTTTGSDGTYMFPPLPPGTYSLNASLAGWHTQNRPAVDILPGMTTHVNLTFDAAPGSMGEIRGKVMNETGAPLFAAFINIGGGKTTDTDASGVFRILSAPGGWVNFTATKAGYIDGSGQAFVPPNGASRYANVTLAASVPGSTGNLILTVQDTVGAPLQGARAWLEYDPGKSLYTDGNGTCLFPGVPAAVHTATAELAGYMTANRTVIVLAGMTASAELVLAQFGTPNGSIAGTVRGNTGAALAGATVQLDGIRRMATTDAAGNYSLDNISAGTYSISASNAGSGRQTMLGVSVMGGMLTTLDFVLGADRTFTNQSLGVSVSGDFSGDGKLAIRSAPPPPELPPGSFDRFFEVDARGFTCMTKLGIVVTGQRFKDSLAGKDLSKLDVRLYTHPSGSWASGDRWEVINDSGYDEKGGFFQANVTHFSIFGIGFSSKSTGPTGTTIVALPPWLSPVAVVAVVLLVGVPIGIIVIRVRQPPTGGGKQNAPAPPPGQSGTNLYP